MSRCPRPAHSTEHTQKLHTPQSRAANGPKIQGLKRSPELRTRRLQNVGTLPEVMDFCSWYHHSVQNTKLDKPLSQQLPVRYIQKLNKASDVSAQLAKRWTRVTSLQGRAVCPCMWLPSCQVLGAACVPLKGKKLMRSGNLPYLPESNSFNLKRPHYPSLASWGVPTPLLLSLAGIIEHREEKHSNVFLGI